MFKHLFLFVLLFISLACADIVFVDIENKNSKKDGKSWSSAFTDIQDAIDAAQSNDEIWITAGKYTPLRCDSLLFGGQVNPESEKYYHVKKKITIRGGFQVSDSQPSMRSKKDRTCITGKKKYRLIQVLVSFNYL